MSTQAAASHANTRVPYFRLGATLAIATLISLSWLVFPYFVQGKQILRDVGDNSRLMKGSSVSQFYSRQLLRHPDLELSATFATPEYFQYVDNANFVSRLRPDLHFIFFVSENIHSGELPSSLPEVVMTIDGVEYLPTKADGPDAPDHHRVSVYSFDRRDTNGNAIDLSTAQSLTLSVSEYWQESPEKLTFTGVWEGPFSLPEELKSSSGITPIAVLALGAGLLSSVLTPCLLQLVVIFSSIIGGFSTVPRQEQGSIHEITPIVRRKIMQTAIAFVIGFVLLYMLAGALIGAVGYQAQLLFAEYSRVVAIIAGVFVVMLGVWVGLRGTSHFACKIPNHQALQSMSVRDNLGSILISMAYALGCTACFGGAIVATLIVYVGAIGSATIGAGIMLIFAVGVAIPFLLAAYYVSRMDSVLIFLALRANLLSKLSMLLIIVFGLILITDNFHTLSDFIYPYLGLN